MLDLAEPAPTRVTTGPDPMPYWEDTAPQLSPAGTRVAYAGKAFLTLALAALIADGDSGAVYLRPSADIEQAYAEKVRFKAKRQEIVAKRCA